MKRRNSGSAPVKDSPDVKQKNPEKKHRNPSMTVILVVALIFMVVAIVASTITLFLGTYRRALIKTASTSGRQTTNQVCRTVSGYITEVSRSMNLLQREADNRGEEREEFFETFLKIRPDVVAVTNYDEAGNVLDCWSLNRKVRLQISRNLSWIKDEKKPHQTYISTPHVMTLFEGEYPWVVTMLGPAEKDGTRVALDISFGNISEYINGVGIGQHGYCFLMDQEGNIIYHPQQQLIYSNLKTENTEIVTTNPDGTYVETTMIYTLQTMTNCPWRVVGVSFVDEMVNESMRDIAWLLVAVAILIGLFALMIGLFLSRAVTRPLRGLSDAMRKFERDADNYVYEPVGGVREISELSVSFEHMVKRLRKLMDTVRSEEINLRKTELKALQAQINPHFLYNTLDSIAWMCERGKTADAVEMVNALARLFRISISRGHELITIKDELMHAESYLKIQAYRYKNQFSYRFDVEESCLSYLCNKITLQPIIENAIYHGINGLVDEGEITITVREQGEDILFTVEDNGAGMEPETVQAILAKERSDHTGIGIKNVNDRLKIYFGSSYGITIDSAPDEGTRVYIKMPKVRKEAEYEKT